VLVCTDGRSGHHWRTRDETAAMRAQEQAASARVGGYSFELLTRPDGRAFEEGARVLTQDFLAALWNAIRAFEPDYLVCPPLPKDPLAGVHPDHWTVAEAVRRIAYMINVPHAFLPPGAEVGAPAAKWIKTPVILNAYDGYMAGENAFDLAFDVESCFDLIAEESWQHQSQIREWLPWVARHHIDPPESLDAWKASLRKRHARQARELGLPSERAWEVFTVTAWGNPPTLDQLEHDLPEFCRTESHLARLHERLLRWRGE
jgi:LmbE family N-acetylglucosaminyl deacetylase